MNKRVFRNGLMLTLFVLLVLGVGLAARSTQAAPLAVGAHWNACYPDYGPFECATVQVPLDYDNQGLAAVSIALVRLPAGDPAQKIGSLFLNPGGPGGSGVDFALSVAPFIYTQAVRDRFDIVGFDPRGVGRSTALRCFGTPRQWTPYFTPFAFPITPEQDESWRLADLYLVDACQQRGSRLIDHMSTADVARDLDLLRQAVGDDGLTYAGLSYGTFLGVTYANLFPQNVRALVVDGVLDPIAWTTGLPGQEDLPFSTRLRSDEGAMEALNEFFRLCDLYSTNCAFGGDSAARFASLAERLRLQPLEVILPDGTLFTFSYQDLIGNALGALYWSGSWPDLAGLLASIEGMLPPQTIGLKLEKFWTDMGYINKRGFPHYPNYLEAFPGVACSDSDNPSNYSAWWQAAQDADAQYGYFGSIWTYASSICSGWPGSKEDRFTGPFTSWTANPVLVAGMRYDPATRYQGAVTVHDLLPNSGLLTVDGWAHCTFMMSTPADARVGDYLIDPTDLPDGEVYPQDWTPFAPALAAVHDTAQLSARLSLHPLVVPQPFLKDGK